MRVGSRDVYHAYWVILHCAHSLYYVSLKPHSSNHLCRFITYYYPPHIIHHPSPTENTLYTPWTEWNGMGSNSPCRMRTLKQLSTERALRPSVRPVLVLLQRPRFLTHSTPGNHGVGRNYLSRTPLAGRGHAVIRAMETRNTCGGSITVEFGHRCPPLLCTYARRGGFDTDAQLPYQALPRVAF